MFIWNSFPSNTERHLREFMPRGSSVVLFSWGSCRCRSALGNLIQKDSMKTLIFNMLLITTMPDSRWHTVDIISAFERFGNGWKMTETLDNFFLSVLQNPIIKAFLSLQIFFPYDPKDHTPVAFSFWKKMFPLSLMPNWHFVGLKMAVHFRVREWFYPGQSW